MFESPAADCSESELSLDDLVHLSDPSVYLMRAGSDALSPSGIFKGDMLVVNRGKTAQAGAVVVAVVSEGLLIRHWQTVPSPALVSPRRDVPDIPVPEEGFEIWGVVTHSLRKHGLCPT